jgi:hypothetical protein
VPATIWSPCSVTFSSRLCSASSVGALLGALGWSPENDLLRCRPTFPSLAVGAKPGFGGSLLLAGGL